MFSINGIATVHCCYNYIWHLSEYMPILFGIRIFNLFKYEGSMSLISLILQQSRKPIRIMDSSSDVIKPEAFDDASFKRWQIKTRMWLTYLKLF
jgi:hypothetical protein